MKSTWFFCLLLLPLQSHSNPMYDCDYRVRHKHIPNYTGAYGYLVSEPSEIKYYSKIPLDAEGWFIPHYEQIGPTSWGKSGATLKHKSYVKVIAQHLGYQFHVKGLLEVSVLNEDGSSNYEVVNYNNFTPVKYWECPIEKAVRFSPVVAQVKSTINPLDKYGRWQNTVQGGEKVFCTESYYQRHRNLKLKSMDMPVMCWINSFKQFGYFEAANLSIVY
ncbi:hypothetical protein [Vibrio agarivorans]|uniref:hypothetical protein n=1 Tax=Vibrio agarivorans TaxID=153622 RepID=UPI002231E62E|nr:hypothetical protein [Vibrio agarivorans]